MAHHKPNAIIKLIDTKGKRHLSSTPAHQESSLQGELFNVMRDSIGLVEGVSSLDAISFARAQNHWNNYGIWGSHKRGKINEYAKRTWMRGKVLLIDFGVLNTGSEHSLPHPAIVIDDVMNMLVVVPMTSEEDGHGNKKAFAADMESRIIRVGKEDSRLKAKNADGTETQWRLKNNSILLVHQIRVVDKNRIIQPVTVGPNQMSLHNTPLMEELEQKISENLCGTLHRDYTRLQSDIEELQKTIDERDAEIAQLKASLTELVRAGTTSQVASVDQTEP